MKMWLSLFCIHFAFITPLSSQSFSSGRFVAISQFLLDWKEAYDKFQKLEKFADLALNGQTVSDYNDDPPAIVKRVKALHTKVVAVDLPRSPFFLGPTTDLQFIEPCVFRAGKLRDLAEYRARYGNELLERNNILAEVLRVEAQIERATKTVVLVSDNAAKLVKAGLPGAFEAWGAIQIDVIPPLYQMQTKTEDYRKALQANIKAIQDENSVIQQVFKNVGPCAPEVQTLFDPVPQRSAFQANGCNYIVTISEVKLTLDTNSKKATLLAQMNETMPQSCPPHRPYPVSNHLYTGVIHFTDDTRGATINFQGSGTNVPRCIARFVGQADKDDFLTGRLEIYRIDLAAPGNWRTNHSLRNSMR